jgi:hypothetical protein
MACLTCLACWPKNDDMTSEITKIIEEAKWAVDLFDQANTGQAIVRMGSRGEILAAAIDDLRKALKIAGHPSLLPDEVACKERTFTKSNARRLPAGTWVQR